MPTVDRNGETIAEGDDVIIAGPIIKIDGDVIHVTTGDGRHAFRANASDVLKAPVNTTAFGRSLLELADVAALKALVQE